MRRAIRDVRFTPRSGHVVPIARLPVDTFVKATLLAYRRLDTERRSEGCRW
jgi:hypothetical protein